VLRQIARELGRDDVDTLVAAGARLLEELRVLDIVAGTASVGRS